MAEAANAAIREARPVRSVRPPPVSLAPGCVWTRAAVLDRIERAAHVVFAFATDRPSSKMAAQQHVVRSVAEAYGWTDAQLRPARPTGRELDEATEAMGWLLWLSDDDRKLVFARALGVKWRRLEQRFRMSERGLRKRHARAVLLIVLRLNA